MLPSIPMIDDVLSSLSALPHRLSTTPSERRAAEYLREKLSRLSLEAEVEPLVAPTTFSWIYFLLYLGFLLAVAVGFYHPYVGFPVALLTAFLFIGEQTTLYTPLSNWVPQGLSHNVSARIPAAGKLANTLCLVAHYDTSKTALIFHPRGVKGLRSAFLVSLAMIALILAGTLALIFLPGLAAKIVKWALFVPAAYMGIMCLGMLERELRGVPVNGASDNATGVAIVIELARRIKEQGGLRGWEVIVLLTGSEEVGLAGMAHFLREKAELLDRPRTVFLNFDNVGGGRVNYVRAEGMLYHLGGDPVLLSIADELTRVDPRFRDVRSRVFDALTLDTLVPAARGYRVLTIMGLNEDGVPYPWHWFNDTLENVDRSVTRLAAEFGWELISRLVASTPSD